MQQYMTGEQVARIVTMPGKAWVNYDADYIQGEFDFDVAAGSTEPMNETFRRQSALQLVDASMPFLEMGVANPMTLYMHILQKGFGIKDASPFLMQQGARRRRRAWSRSERRRPRPEQGALPMPGGVPPSSHRCHRDAGQPMPQQPMDLTQPHRHRNRRRHPAQMLMAMMGRTARSDAQPARASSLPSG